MKNLISRLCVVLPFFLFSCATTPPPAPFHNTDNTAFIIESLDGSSCRVIAPTAIDSDNNAHVLIKAKSFIQHQTAVVILENYTESQLGNQFRDRAVDWFIKLRGLGYQHIFFLKGSGVSNPDGLLILAEYD